ncbi:2,3-diaminopropionate biosynthesis protein SbnA [Actinomycetospora chiangmaiensis]|uniref:2,3-diaminopropionate biosynthesis protein SbnA n=1 Tax=Actinomycetospora chiangmaiensis TaxID=402650 RepID=UPI00035F5C12|nr:2,3-diaminopropionate biosynthesis protein SbnA [Actinomycetospora chiangmaiensis]
MTTAEQDDAAPTTRIQLHGLDAATVAVAPGTTVRVSYLDDGRATLVGPDGRRTGPMPGPVRDGRSSAGSPVPRPTHPGPRHVPPPNIVSSPQQFNTHDLFVDMRPIVDQKLFCKVEGMNFAGSVKLKAAAAMVEAAEAAGQLNPWSIIVESSSGNLGVALAMVSANRGYRFICVTDDRCNPQTRRLMETYGAEVHVVSVPNPVTGLLGARLDHLRALCERDPDTVWLNQYENPANAGAHYATTAPSIARAIPGIEVLLVGAGTCGTLMGNARWFKQHRPDVRVVAIDVEGSVSFGGPASPRHIPGLGMGMTPPALDRSLIDDVVIVPEVETVRMCQRLAMRGFLFGGSTGTVVAGAARWLARHAHPGTTAVTIAPDQGERYLDTVYAPEWREQHYGPAGDLSRSHRLPAPTAGPPAVPTPPTSEE